MAGSITIALDAMGGDHAPEMVLRGADIALERHPGTKVLLAVACTVSEATTDALLV